MIRGATWCRSFPRRTTVCLFAATGWWIRRRLKLHQARLLTLSLSRRRTRRLQRNTKGELPNASPSRPQGKERNVVVTMWDWADPKVYLHDDISSDKRNPTVNANGPIYGALEESGDYLTVVDPTHTATNQIKLTV